ncbi:uncharacterized protein PG986_000517 [Apiospora aurea]|uniref:Uncharacterized protein n=1 Tax=Apiospora aurea TaxID=335848 RepID=A0ABR1QVY5_9PEZI
MESPEASYHAREEHVTGFEIFFKVELSEVHDETRGNPQPSGASVDSGPVEITRSNASSVHPTGSFTDYYPLAQGATEQDYASAVALASGSITHPQPLTSQVEEESEPNPLVYGNYGHEYAAIQNNPGTPYRTEDDTYMYDEPTEQ